MYKSLTEAAKKGDVQTLHNLIKDDPFLLRVGYLSTQETPLHIACIAGHVNFAKEVLNLRPEFATELDQDGFSPLHIASANGDVEIVKEFLKVGPHICLVNGKERRIPLHYAVIKGRKQVIQELLSVCLDSVTEVTARGENCCHLALKNNQFDSFKVLFDHVVLFKKEGVLNKKDEQGNSILHLAASRKQYEVFDLLLDEKFASKDKLEMNSLNKLGLTPLDVLVSEGGDSEIEEMLRLYGALGVEEMNSFPSPHLVVVSHESSPMNTGQEPTRERSKCASKKLQDYFKYDKIKDSPTKVRNTLLVIAVLIATATYQPVLSPPGGVWQDDYWPNPNNITTSEYSNWTRPPPPHTAGQAIMATHNQISYGLFLVFNTIGFQMSLHMLNFLTLGLPMQFELRVSLFALTATYDTCIIAITPSGSIYVFFIVLSVVMPLLMPILTMVVRDYRKVRLCR
ncbi:hypothetical protein ACJIZ3_019732 [Penstemon smallii]|uniref:PGG domain-containing protein n=1 Tax=Penstemon smallii TaxID=265156 RepID=A0ABD3T216_9LAMI